MKLVASVFACGLVAAPALAQEPSLAELARREKKARSGQVKVITEADLKGSGSVAGAATEEAAAAPASTAAAGAGSPAKPSARTDEQLRAEKKAEIEKKIAELTTQIAAERKRIEDVQPELGDLTNYTFGSRRASLQQTIDEATANIAKAQQSISDLEEQARRLGLPLSR